MEAITLTRKLTTEEQNDILGTLFDLQLVDNYGDGHLILYDGDGNEFYGSNENCQFNLSTLGGIFSYTAFYYRKLGSDEAKYKIKQVLGII